MPSKNSVKTEGFQIRCITKGFLWSLIITTLLSLLVSLLLHFTPLSEGLLPGFSTFIFLISMFLGAVIGSRAAGCMGLLHGVSISMLYWLLILVISLIWGLESLVFLQVLKRLAFTLAAGIAGGIIGIGLAEKQIKRKNGSAQN